MADGWEPDFLGDGYEFRTLELGNDDEGPVEATLVRYFPAPPPTAGSRLQRFRDWLQKPRTPDNGADRPVHAVLYLHGWSDYFFQTELAAFWAGEGVAFYALDLRKYGRSLRPGQTPGYVTSLDEYDADIEAAFEAVKADLAVRFEQGQEIRITLMAHSTGGLVASLWADRHPGRIHALILNSPWLELQGSSIVRNATAGLLEPLARFRPKARLKLPELGHYWRSISREGDGEWDLNPQWRPETAFPVRAGWLTAVMAGHSRVAHGLAVNVPILVLASAKSLISHVWHENMLSQDIVLDVTLMTQRALNLGPQVTVLRFEGALHDLLLSAKPVREQVYGQLRRWARGFMLD